MFRSVIIIPVRMCINYFSYQCDKIPGKIQLKEGIVYFSLKYKKGYSPECQQSHDHRYVKQLVTFLSIQEAERDKCCCSTNFLLFIQSMTSVHDMMLSIIRVSLLC